MSHTMGWADALAWGCVLFALGSAGIAFVCRPRRNRRIHDGHPRFDERDFLARFYRNNGRTL
jgi:hypothetical protein